MADDKKVNDKKVGNILSARRTIPNSSYDLLEGAFKVATKARNAGIAMLSISLIILTYFIVIGTLTESRIKTINSRAENVKSEQIKVSAELGVVEGYPDVTPLSLLNKQTRVVKDLRELTIAQASTFSILDNLKSTMVPGVQLRAITFCSSEPNTSGECGKANQKDTPEKVTQVKYISIDFSVEDLAIASQWVSNIKQMAWVKNVQYYVSGKNVKIYAEIIGDICPPQSLNTVKGLGFSIECNINPPLPGEGR